MSLVVKIEGTALDAIQIARKSASTKLDYEKKRSMSVTLFFTASDGLPVTGQDIQILEDTTIKFGGIINNVAHIPVTPSQAVTADIACVVSSSGYNYVPQRRTIDVLESDTTSGAVVTKMITNYLSYEGVTAGTISTGATIDNYNGRYTSIKEVLDDMAEMSGYTWNIDDNKALNFVTPTTLVTSTQSLDTDDGDHFDFRPTDSLNNFRNKQFIEGGLDATGEVIRTFVEDSANIASRATAEGNSGVYGKVVRDTNIQTLTDATAVATELLNRYKNVDKASFKSYTAFVPGEVITVNYPKYDIASGTKYLIVSRSAKRDAHVWVYTHKIEQRDVSNYSSKPADNVVDFFSKLSKNTSIGESNTSITTPKQTTEDTAITLTAATVHTETFTFSVIKTMYSMITVDAEIDCASASKVDIVIKQDTVIQYDRKSHLNADIDTLNVTTSLDELTIGVHTVTVDITSSVAGTINDLKIDCQQFVDEIVTIPAPTLVSASITNL